MDDSDKKVLTKTAYEHLVAAVGKMLAESEKAGRDADTSKAKVNWEIGDRLVETGLIGRNHYGESVLEQLAEDLETDPQTLRRCIVFRQVYDRENLYRSVQHLTWSHYRQLIEVHDDAARRYYEDRAVKEGWSRDRMRAAIAGREYEREVKKDEAAGILKRPTDAEYVFWVEVVKVVDADTLLLNIDSGFKNWRHGERIRLAKLNAPELTTKKGKEAHIYVRDQLAKARGIVVKTEKADDFGRYVAHVFYSLQDDRLAAVYENGIYLNDELLKKGLAERM
jgi:endonuclease YncB( thermonuclease family)